MTKQNSSSFLYTKAEKTPRYLKEHVAVALGIIAVLVVAIVALSKSLGPKKSCKENVNRS